MKSKLALYVLLFFVATFVALGQDRSQIHATCSAVVDLVKYKAICYGDETIVIKGRKSAFFKIDAYDSGFSSFSFTDFNGDGYKDLLIEYTTNVPGICNLVLYHKTSKKFVSVEGFDRYPSSQRLPGTKVYYSYHRSGCADSNWDSDLFVIKNFRLIKLGNISGAECGDSVIKDGIYIYKVKKDKRTLYSTLLIKTINRYKNYKWGFIKAYWQKHYKEFIN